MFFFFNDTATTEIYTLSLHDALPIYASDINAFALPGGPMYVNRGMIEAARSEGEMAGVMAHEISHVALRHATAQATETQTFQIGSVLGQIAEIGRASCRERV